jgi:hypothetical protein
VNLRGAILQDEPKTASRDLFQVILLPCISIAQAQGWFGQTAAISCTSNANCTKPGDKCLVEPNGYSFDCGNPIVYDQHFQLCDEPSSKSSPTMPPPSPIMTSPTPLASQPTSLPPPPPTTSPPPLDGGNRDLKCITFADAFDYYLAYINPEDARGVNCRSHTECSGGQSCLLAMDYTRFFCGIPNDQDYVLCDETEVP